MEYPIFQISDEQWKSLHEFDVEYSDKITIKSKKKLKEYFLFSEYIDCYGEIYKVTDFQALGILSKIFQFVPLIPFTVKLIFTKANKNLNLEEFREFVLKRANEVSDYKEFGNIVLNAKTFVELMGDQC
jgi:hypothetical protein